MNAPPLSEFIEKFRRQVLDKESAATLFYGYDGKKAYAPLANSVLNHPADTVALLAEGSKIGEFPRLDWAVLATDAYVQTNPDPKGARSRGTLERRFQAGDPSVSECLMLAYRDRDGDAWMCYLPYKRRHLPAINREVLDIGEPDVHQQTPDSRFDGFAYEALGAFFE